jgi:hypothetical protein
MRQMAASQSINTSFSHYFVPVFTNFLSGSSSLCCFVEKSIRVDLTRQGSQFCVNREEVLAGTFFLHNRPIIILFDSGASDDFMCSVCAKKAKLSLVATEVPYVISTPRGQVDMNRIV